jgi:hypothetical protein
MYDAAAAFWQLMFQTLVWGIEENIIGYMPPDRSRSSSGPLRVGREEDPMLVASRYYWGANQRFFRSLCVALKVPAAVAHANIALGEGMSVVIGLQSTGEAASRASRLHLHESSGEPLASPLMILRNIIDKLFPIPPAPEESVKSSGLEESEADSDESPLPGSHFGQFKKRKFLDIEQSEGQTHKRTFPQPEQRLSPLVIDLVSDSEDEESFVPIRLAEANPSNSISTSPSPTPTGRDSYPTLSPTKSLTDSSLKVCVSPSNSTGNVSPSKTELRQLLIERVNKLKDLAMELQLPGHPLDDLIEQLGGVNQVAELTGRKYRYVRCHQTGKLIYSARSPHRIIDEEDFRAKDEVNDQERLAFMNGDKRVAIISDACSCGISLHSDERVKNKQRRLHLTLELAWAADKAIQQLGRTHRSNQVVPPQYRLLITPYGGERRFVCAVTKRLESLGALTQGDRRASMDAFADFPLDSKEGKSALKELSKSILALIPDNDFPPLDFEESSKTLALLETFPHLLSKRMEIHRLSLGENTEPLNPLCAAAIWLASVGINEERLASERTFTVPIFLNRLLSLEGNRQEILFRVSLPLVPLS